MGQCLSWACHVVLKPYLVKTSKGQCDSKTKVRLLWSNHTSDIPLGAVAKLTRSKLSWEFMRWECQTAGTPRDTRKLGAQPSPERFPGVDIHLDLKVFCGAPPLCLEDTAFQSQGFRIGLYAQES